MRQSLKPLFAAVFLSALVWQLAGNGVAIANPQEKDPIQSIRQQYAAINKRGAKYKKVKKELSGFSAEGGELVAYFDGSAIVKIAATYYGETGRSNEEYYFQNEKLIFVYRKESTYSRPLSGKVIRTKEERFYFEGDRLIKWIDENGKAVSPGEEYQKQQDDYLETSRKFVIGARSKDSTIEA